MLREDRAPAIFTSASLHWRVTLRVEICMLALVAAAAATAGAPQPERTPERGAAAGHAAAAGTAEVTQFLGEALFGRDALSSERAIIALRRLREPSLRPLFSQMAGLVSSEGAATGTDGVGGRSARAAMASPLRRHGILGLAELSDPPRIDLLMVKTIEDRDERAALLREAVELDLIGTEDLREVSRWPDLRPLVRARTFGQLVSAGELVESFRLRELLEEDSIASVYASVLLLEIGGGSEGVMGVHIGDRAPLERLVARQVHAQPEIETLVTDIRRFDLQAGRPIVEALATEGGTPPVLRFEAIRALLSIAPDDPEVCAAWRTALTHSADAAAKARLALAALEVVSQQRFGKRGRRPRPFGGDVFEAMSAAGGELLAAMAEAGRSVAGRGRVEPGPLMALVRHGHEATSAWVLEVAGELPTEDATALRLEVLRTGQEAMREGYYVGPVVEAAAMLATESPEALEAVLRESADKSHPLYVEAVLSGALRTAGPDVPRAWMPGEGIRWPNERCASMAALLRVRQGQHLGPEAYDELAAIAMGRGDLNEGLRVQAAWLALLCRGEGRSALARILADAPE